MGRPWAMRWTERTLALVIAAVFLAPPAWATESDGVGSDEAAPPETEPSEAEPSAEDAENVPSNVEEPSASTAVEKEVLSLTVQVGDVTLLIERPAEEGADVVVEVIETPEGDVAASANESVATVDASLVVELIQAVVEAAEHTAPTEDETAQALETLRSFATPTTEPVFTFLDSGRLVIVLEPPTPTMGSGGPSEPDVEDEPSPGGCACGSASPEDDDAAWSPPAEVTRTYAYVRDTATREIERASEELTRRVPLVPTPQPPTVPQPEAPRFDPVPEPAPPAPKPTAQTTQPSPPSMPLAAKAAIATMALAGIAVPLASAGNGAWATLHKALFALRRAGAWLVGIPLYAKLKRDQVLAHPVRENILALVQAEPGIHAQALRRELDLGWGTLAHHLRVLSSWGLLVLQRDGNKVKAFPSEWSPAERRRAAALANPGTSQVYEAIARLPGVEQRQVAETVGRSHPTVIWHAQRLERAGLIRVERRGRRTAYFATPLP